MSIFRSRTWTNDLDEVLNSFQDLETLSGKSILITGCTGLICSAIVDVLIRWNEKNNKKINVFAAGRNEQRVRMRFEEHMNEEWFHYVPYDSLADVESFDFHADYIVHGASNAYPKLIVEEPVETLISNVIGIDNLLSYARLTHAQRVLYVSSSEVYGKKSNNEPFSENEYGSIDNLYPRNSYAVGKCAAEALCIAYAEEYGVDSVIVRPGHVYGPTASKSDNRVSSNWPFMVAKGEDIVMKSDGKQIRSYCYCLDCASAILTVLIKGESRKAYNISNPTSVISIREMASILTEAAGVKLSIEAPTEQEKKGFNPMLNSSLNGESLEKLGWSGLFDAACGFSHTVSIIKEMES